MTGLEVLGLTLFLSAVALYAKAFVDKLDREDK